MTAPERVLVLGAGAIGGSIGALLAEAGVPVTLVARGEHGDALRERGVDLRLPDRSRLIPVPCVATTEELAPTHRDLVLLSVMTHDTDRALAGVPPETPIASLQNGTLAIERIRARGHPLVAGMVYVPAERRAPGVIALSGSPVPGTVLLGGWQDPEGAPHHAEWLAGQLRTIGFRSDVEGDVAPWIRAKLLTNTGGSIAALCDDAVADVLEAAQAEVRAVWDDAEVPYRSAAELRSRVGELRTVHVDGRPRVGGSTRHALARGQRLETAGLFEPVRALAATVGVPTPVNDALVELAERAATLGWRPGSLTAEELRRAVGLESEA